MTANSRVLATVGADRIIKFWELSTGVLLRSIEHHEAINKLLLFGSATAVIVHNNIVTVFSFRIDHADLLKRCKQRYRQLVDQIRQSSAQKL